MALLIHTRVIAGHTDVDAHLVEFALVPPAVPRLYGDIATCDAIEEAIELLAAFSRTTASTAGEAPIVPGS